jgi:hypothetical protein
MKIFITTDNADCVKKELKKSEELITSLVILDLEDYFNKYSSGFFNTFENFMQFVLVRRFFVELKEKTDPIKFENLVLIYRVQKIENSNQLINNLWDFLKQHSINCSKIEII